eukprot:359602-Chlamydomonas_euryale.AAC.2
MPKANRRAAPSLGGCVVRMTSGMRNPSVVRNRCAARNSCLNRLVAALQPRTAFAADARRHSGTCRGMFACSRVDSTAALRNLSTRSHTLESWPGTQNSTWHASRTCMHV